MKTNKSAESGIKKEFLGGGKERKNKTKEIYSATQQLGVVTEEKRMRLITFDSRDGWQQQQQRRQ